MANYRILIRQVATLENARLYAATQDKFIFCLDLLDLSLMHNGDEYCAVRVEKLEDRFDIINRRVSA